MSVSQILAGIFFILMGAFFIAASVFIIFLITRDEESRLFQNPFFDFLSMSKLRQRANGIVAGIFGCLIGLVWILYGLGYLR
jgi:hypothetical protein